MHTDITLILDRSGSMASIASDVVGGLNTFIQAQKEGEGTANFTLVQFDDQYEVVHSNVPMQDVPPLGPADFEPRGSTALLDAVGRTVVEIDRRLAAAPPAQRPARIIVVVQTDGQENASREFTREQVFDLIRQREEAPRQPDVPVWEFVFLAANQDAIAEGGQMGFQADKAVNFDANAGSVLAMNDVVAAKVLMVRNSLSDMSYSAVDRARTRRRSS